VLRRQRDVEAVAEDLEERFRVGDAPERLDHLQGVGLRQAVVQLPQCVDEERFDQRLAHAPAPEFVHLLLRDRRPPRSWRCR